MTSALRMRAVPHDDDDERQLVYGLYMPLLSSLYLAQLRVFERLRE